MLSKVDKYSRVAEYHHTERKEEVEGAVDCAVDVLLGIVGHHRSALCGPFLINWNTAINTTACRSHGAFGKKRSNCQQGIKMKRTVA